MYPLQGARQNPSPTLTSHAAPQKATDNSRLPTMVISEDAGRAALAPSPPPTPVPPSDTPLDYTMEAPRLASTLRLPLDGVDGMHRIDNSSSVSHKLIFSSPDGRSSAATSAPVPHATATTTRMEVGTQSTFLHDDSGVCVDGVNGIHRIDNPSTVSHKLIFSPPDGCSSAATSAPGVPHHDTATTTRRRELGTQSTFLHDDSGAGEDGVGEHIAPINLIFSPPTKPSISNPYKRKNTPTPVPPTIPAKRTKSSVPTSSSTPSSHKQQTPKRIDVQKEKASETKTLTNIKSKSNKQKKTVKIKLRTTLNITPIERLNATKSKIKNIVFGPTILHASLRDCFFDPIDVSSPKVAKTISHGSSSIAILHARNGFPASVQRSPRSSPTATSTSDTVVAKRSSRRISSLEKTNPLKTTKSQLVDVDSSPPFLIHNSMLRRLLLEDILISNVGDRLLFAVSEVHPMYESYERVLHDLPHRHPVRKLRDEVFHQLPATVVKNSFRESLIGSVTNEGLNTKQVSKATKSMSYKYFSNLLGGNGGGAICVKFDGTSHEIEVKWKEIYFHATSIHIWGDTPFRFNFRQMLRDRKSTQDALFKRLMTEVDGDRMLTIFCFHISSIYSLGSHLYWRDPLVKCCIWILVERPLSLANGFRAAR
jgi:hypothetical protein